MCVFSYENIRSLVYHESLGNIFFHFSTKTYVVGTQKICPTERVLLSTKTNVLNDGYENIHIFTLKIFAYLDLCAI